MSANLARDSDHGTGQGAGESGLLDTISWAPGNSDGYRLSFGDGTLFLVDPWGSRIWAVWPDSMTLEDTAVYLLGTVLGFVLRLRGVACLHASAFAVDGRVIALAGPSGAGKSTTAAAFAERGFMVLADDLLALEERRDAVVAHPGCPRLRLRPEAVEMLYGTPDALPLLTPNWYKRFLDLRDRSCGPTLQALPLSAIYLLDERRTGAAKVIVESVGASAALFALLANSHTDIHLDKRSRAREFSLLGRLADSLPVKRVIGRAGADSLAEVCDAIIGDLNSTPATWSKRVG